VHHSLLPQGAPKQLSVYQTLAPNATGSAFGMRHGESDGINSDVETQVLTRALGARVFSRRLAAAVQVDDFDQGGSTH